MSSPVSKLKVKVIPGASGSVIAGWLGDTIKIRVAAPPEKGKANAAVIDLVSKALQIPEGNIQVISGKKSQLKVLEIKDLSHTELLQRLANIT